MSKIGNGQTKPSLILTLCVASMLWFNFILGLIFVFVCFKLIITNYHTQKQKKIKIKPRIKLNHNIYLGEERQHIEQTFFSKETLRWQLALNSDLKNTKFEVLTIWPWPCLHCTFTFWYQKTCRCTLTIAINNYYLFN